VSKKRISEHEKGKGKDRDYAHEIGCESGRRIHSGSDGEKTRSCSSNTGDEYTHNGVEDDDDNDRAVHYFNHASQALLSTEVKKLGIELIRASPWNNTENRHSAQYCQERVRSLFATIIDCDEKDEAVDSKEIENTSTGSRIAVFPSTAFAITLAARNIIEQRRKREDCGGCGRILVLQDEFDSAIYPWQQMCDESKGRLSLDIVEHPDEGFRERSSDDDDSDGDGIAGGWTRAVLKKIESNNDIDKIIAACLPPLHWSDGTILDLEAIGAACKDRNIPLIVDATQAVGIMPCSVRKIRPMMLACSTHKWLRGPSGCCLSYISSEVQDNWIPLDFHGRGRDFEAGPTSWDVSRNEMGPKGYPEKYYGDARKFDSGGKANPLLLPMLRKAMEEVARIDPAEAQLHLKVLMQPLLDWAAGNDYSVKTGPRAYHLIGLVPNEKTPEEMIEIAKRLATEKGVILAVRCGGFRVSPYLTNTTDNVRKLIDGLEDLS